MKNHQFGMPDTFAVHLPYSGFLWYVIAEKSLAEVSHWLKSGKALHLNILSCLYLDFILEILQFPLNGQK